MDDITIAFTSKINQKLKRIEKNQKQFARELDIDYSTLNKILNNKRELDYSTAVKMAKNLSLSLDKLTNISIHQTYEELLLDLDDLVFNLKNVKP